MCGVCCGCVSGAGGVGCGVLAGMPVQGGSVCVRPSGSREGVRGGGMFSVGLGFSVFSATVVL